MKYSILSKLVLQTGSLLALVFCFLVGCFWCFAVSVKGPLLTASSLAHGQSNPPPWQNQLACLYVIIQECSLLFVCISLLLQTGSLWATAAVEAHLSEDNSTLGLRGRVGCSLLNTF